MNMNIFTYKTHQNKSNELWSIKEEDDERLSKYKVGDEIKWKAMKINANAHH